LCLPFGTCEEVSCQIGDPISKITIGRELKVSIIGGL
jgi:hypothetical protein